MFFGELLEPCNGAGDISDILLANGHHRITCTDIVDGLQYDATTREYWDSLEFKPDWTISNPPFNRATDITRLALEYSKKGVIMLLRSSYLEPCRDRRDVLEAGLSRMTIVNPRPKFRADTKGSDSCTVAFFTWEKGYTGDPVIGYLKDWHKDPRT
jgi:hypothetical protein